MKYGIGFRLGMLLAVFGILASALTGYYSYTSSRSLLLAAVQRDLLTATQVLSRNMRDNFSTIGKDVLLLSSLPRVTKVLTYPDGRSIDEDTQVVASIFKSMLSTHPEYFQIRLIAADKHGIEMVRVDRDGAGLTRVTQGDLQEKAYLPYVFETLRLPSGGIYLSKIGISREIGGHSAVNKPTVRVATPVYSSVGKVLGLIVISIDLNGLFNLLKADLPDTYHLYLSNDAGDFLIHPDATQTFGFELGRRILVQDSFEPVTALVAGERPSVVMTIQATDDQPDHRVVAFVRTALGDVPAKRSLIVGLSQPLGNVELETTQLARYTMQAVFVLSILALLMAVLVSHLVVRPLNKMVEAIKHFSKTRVIGSLPVQRNDEIGLLARSFHVMQTEIIEHLEELYDHRNTLEHDARHDSLTGLANRVLFNDRLRHAISQAKRDNTSLGLMFVDLDKFKEVNDSLGHHIGDLLLKAVAARLLDCVRESDTVGRLGGDEFVVLLPMLDGQQDALLVAEKIRHSINQPLDLEGQYLITSASVGIAIYPEHGSDEIQLAMKSDSAMYLAKRGGSNRVHLYQN